MNRRNFIQKSCTACAGLAGLGFLLQSCGSSLPVLKTTTADKTISIAATKFQELNSNLLLIRNRQLESDILLIKNSDTYKALFLKCTHQGVALTATGSKIVCSAHGSVFDFNGNVVKEPALKPLHEFKTELTENNIIIHLT